MQRNDEDFIAICRLAKKTMFKVAFHGGLSNFWSSLMTIPEVKRSMNLNFSE
jgi:hypothetical protein